MIKSVSNVHNYYSQPAPSGPLTVGAALAALKANPRLRVAIADTTQNLTLNLAGLSGLSNNITQISQTDAETGIVSVTATGYSRYSNVLEKFSTNYRLNVTDAQAQSATALAANDHVLSFTVSDNSVNIAGNISNLDGQTKLARVTVTSQGAPLALTAAQLADNADAISKIAGSYSLSIADASCADALSYVDNLHVRAVTVADTVSAISGSLDDLVSLGLRLKKVSSVDSNVLNITAAQVQADAAVIGKLYQGYQLALQNASLAQANNLYRNKKIVSIDVVDTAANISRGVDLLSKLGGSLNSIHVTDLDHALQITSNQYTAQAAGIARMVAGDDYKLVISGASAAEAGVFAGNDHVTSISVTDTAAAIASAFDDLSVNDKVTAVGISGRTATLAISSVQFINDNAVLDKIRGNYRLTVSGVDADSAAALLQNNSHISAITVAGTASQLTGDIADLAAAGRKITAVTQHGAAAPLELSVSEWRNYQDLLNKFVGGCSVNLSAVSAAAAVGYAQDSRVQGIFITDSAASISLHWDELRTLGAQITGLRTTDASPVLYLTASQWQNSSQLLDKIEGTYSISVRGATASQIGSMLADSHVTAVDATDSTVNIASELDAIHDAVQNRADIAISLHRRDTAGFLGLTSNQLTADADVLALIQGNYYLQVSAVAPDQATTLAQDHRVAGMSVTGTGGEITGNLSALNALGSKVIDLNQSDPQNDLNLTLGDWVAYQNLLGKFGSGLSVTLSEVPAAQAAALLGDSRVDSVAVTDSGSHIAAGLDALQALGPALTSITQSDTDTPLRLSMAQYAQDAAALAKLNDGYSLYVYRAAVADAATLGIADHVAQIAVTDTVDNVANGLEALSQNNRIDTISVSGAAARFAMTTEQRTTYADALSKIVGGYKLVITNAAAADASTLGSDSRVATWRVVDSTANLVGSLASINAAGSKVQSITLNDAPSNLSMSYSQWTQFQPVLARIGSAYTVAVTGVAADKVAALASDPRVASLSVSDTVAHIVANLDVLEQNANLLTAISSSDAAQPSMTITATQYLGDADALAKINAGSYTLNVTNASVDQALTLSADSKVSNLDVKDSAANLSDRLASLLNLAQLRSITVSDAAAMSLTDATYQNAASKIVGSYSAHIVDVAAARASALNADGHVLDYNIADSASAIDGSLSTLLGYTKLTGIQVTSDNGPITLTQSAFSSLTADDLSRLSGSYRLHLTGAAVQDLPADLQNANVAVISVADTAQNISRRFDQLTQLAGQIDSIDLTDAAPTPIALTTAQYAYAGATLGKIAGDYQLAITDATAQDAAYYAGLDHVATVSVSDGSANISAQVDALAAIVGKLDLVNNNDGGAITLTQAQYDADRALFSVPGLDPANYKITE